MTLLAEVARVSAAVAATASRLEKTRLLAECLRTRGVCLSQPLLGLLQLAVQRG